MLRVRVSSYARIINRRHLTTAEYLKNIEEYDGGSGGVNAFVAVNLRRYRTVHWTLLAS